MYDVSIIKATPTSLSYTGRLPYGSKDIASTCESLLLYLKGGNRLPLPEQCSDKMYEILITTTCIYNI